MTIKRKSIRKSTRKSTRKIPKKSNKTSKRSVKKITKTKSDYEKIIKRHKDRILWLQPERSGINGGDADMEIDFINRKINKLKKKIENM